MDCLPDITMEVVEVSEPEPEESENNDELIAELETPKPKMSQEQIFQEPPKMKVVKEEKPKKKRVLSEEHKQKLAVARQKALETRRKNAALKKEEKELQKRIKQNKMNDLRKQANVSVVEEEHVEVSEPIDIPKEEPKPVKPIQSLQQNFTKEDLTNITMNAIMGYDRLRKQEKAEKKKEEEALRQKEMLKQQLAQTIAPPSQPKFYSTNGKWDDFF